MRAELDTAELELSPPPELMVKYLVRARQLRMLPAVASEALEIAKDPDCSIEAFTSIVERDVKLAADILKIANSLLYAPKFPSTNLHVAVVRLGFKECQNLILASSIASLMSRLSREQDQNRSVLEQHSLATGYLATYLNRTFHFGFRGEEFTAGMMHDFGRVLLSVIIPEKFTEIDALEFDESPAILAHEIQVIGTDHTRLGAWFAMMNQLPSPIPEVILNHHQPELANSGRCLTALVSVADHMANHLQRFGESDGYDPTSNPGLSVLSEFAPVTFPTQFRQVASSLMEQVRREFEIG